MRSSPSLDSVAMAGTVDFDHPQDKKTPSVRNNEVAMGTKGKIPFPVPEGSHPVTSEDVDKQDVRRDNESIRGIAILQLAKYPLLGS